MTEPVEPEEPAAEQTATVMVLPHWRLLHDGTVYEAGDQVRMPLSVAVQWLGWGSVI